MMPRSSGYVLGANEGDALWFFGSLATVKAGEADTGGGFTLVEFLNPPGFSPPVHVHHDEDEAFYILEGTATFHCGKEAWTAGAGDFVLLPKGIPHWFRVTDDAALRSLQISTPARFEQFAAAVGQPAEARRLPPPPDAPPNFPQLAQISDHFGIELLGPPPEAPG